MKYHMLLTCLPACSINHREPREESQPQLPPACPKPIIFRLTSASASITAPKTSSRPGPLLPPPTPKSLLQCHRGAAMHTASPNRRIALNHNVLSACSQQAPRATFEPVGGSRFYLESSCALSPGGFPPPSPDPRALHRRIPAVWSQRQAHMSREDDLCFRCFPT